MSNEFITDDELKAIKLSDKGNITKSTGQMSEDECKKIISAVKTRGTFDSDSQALIAITGLCQLGATNRNAGRSISYTYKGKTLTSGEFLNICQGVKGGGTPRQFARTMGSTIAKIAINLQEPGDLSRQIKLDHPNITLEEECWCSNFQSINPDCPDLVREWLREDFRKRFNE
jgi:hypothetical protein